MADRFIYLVDDNPAHRTLVRRAIVKAKLPYSFCESGSLLEARKQLFSSTATVLDIALLVLDLNLIDGRGSTLIAEIRASSGYKALPILVLSTSGLETDVNECLTNGANRYLTKSDDITVFTEQICEAVAALLSGL